MHELKYTAVIRRTV